MATPESATTSGHRSPAAHPWRALWELVQGERLRYALATASLCASVLALFLLPLAIRWAVDGLAGTESPPFALPPMLVAVITPLAALFGSPWAEGPVILTPRQGLFAAGALCFAATVLAGLFSYLRSRGSALAAEGITLRLRNRLLRHLERLPARTLDRRDTGDLVQRCTSDVETVRVFLATQVVEIGNALFLFFAVVPILFLIDAPTTWVSIALYPAILACAGLFFHRFRRVFQEVDEAEGALTTVLQENLTGIRVVRAFAGQNFERRKFGRFNADFRDKGERMMRTLGGYWAFSDLLCLIQIALVLFFGAWRAQTGAISLGDLQAFLLYESMVIWPVRQLGRIISEASKAVVALGRLGEILGEPLEPAPSTPRPSGSASAGDGLAIRFERVSFRHGDPWVLREVSFQIEAGETLALLGPPGAGKSTLLHLLLCLYEPSSGRIELGGQDLSALEPEEAREQISAVLQDPFLFSRTITENLQVGRNGASAEDLRGACEEARIAASIDSFPDRFDTLLGERGVTLSGGQRQRLALARALLKEAPVLLLDDVLSAVDTETEHEILSNLQTHGGRRTTLIVSHRLSTVMHADRILVLDRGRIVQAGTPETLKHEPGPFRRLWEIQGKLERDIDQSLEQAQP